MITVNSLSLIGETAAELMRLLTGLDEDVSGTNDSKRKRLRRAIGVTSEIS